MARRKKSEKRSRRSYFICLAVYGAVLTVAAIIALGKVWDYAEEYEASRPELVMDEYVAHLSENLANDAIESTIASMEHKFQTNEQCVDIVKQILVDGVSYVRKSSGGDSSDTVLYELRCGDKTFGSVELTEDKDSESESKYGMLPWKIYTESFNFEGLYSSVRITVPRTFSVMLNGQKMGEEYIVENNIHYNVLEDYYEYCANLPTKVTYEYTKLFGIVDPVLLDERGVETTIDETLDDSQFISQMESGAQLNRLRDFTNLFTAAYLDYVCGIKDPSYGYQLLAKYMKLGSDLDSRMKQAMDGLTWSHTYSLRIDGITFNGAIDLGDGFYICDVTSVATTLSPNGEKTDTQNMKVFVTDNGVSVLAIMMEIYV